MILLDFVFYFQFLGKGKETRRTATVRAASEDAAKLFLFAERSTATGAPSPRRLPGSTTVPVTEHLWRLRQEQAAKENDEASSFEVDAGTGLLIKSPATTDATLVRYDFSANNNLLDKYPQPMGVRPARPTDRGPRRAGG